ncbi:MAG: FAD-dependent oxidoreductase [Actinomycetales bacterium]|nr:MAG: FAD-dependent oxidoreductase [Actinomycetales bacterium]
MTSRHLVVVGASLAGLRAVEAARKAGHEGPITLVGAEAHLPYDRPPLSKQYFDSASDPVDTQFRAREHLDELGVTVRLGRSATGLDPEARHVLLDDGTSIGFDSLVIATGVAARKLPGAEHLDRVVGLRTKEDAQAIRDALDAGERVVVVGCGFIGSEVASAIWKRGRSCTLVELAPVPLTRAVGAQVGQYFSDLHRRNGVDLRLGTGVTSVQEQDDHLVLELDDGTSVDAHLVVLGLGAVPSTAWLAGSGVDLAPDGSIVADATLATTLPGVYAAGDVVTWHNELFDRSMRLEHWTSAAEQAAVAARNAVRSERDGASESYATVPYFWSDLYGKRIQFVGVHGGAEAGEVLTIGDAESQVVLYREGDRLSAALTIDQPRLTMKLRKLIAEGATFDTGVDLVHTTLERFAAV